MEFSAIYLIILALVSISLVSIIVLSISHLISGNTCPKLFGIAACYLLTPVIFLILISHLDVLNDKSIILFIGSAIAVVVAIFASISHIKGTLECPKLFGKIPMCYLSLLTFGTVIILKLIEINS